MINAFAFAILSGLFYTASNLISRYVLKDGSDHWAYSFFFSLVGFIATVPMLFFFDSVLADPGIFEIGILAIAPIIIFAHNWLVFKATNYLSASIVGVLSKFRLVWIFILEFLFISQFNVLGNILGAVLVMIATSLFFFKTEDSTDSDSTASESRTGIYLLIASTVLYGIVTTLFRFTFDNFSVPFITSIVVFFIPAILNYLIMPDRNNRIVKLFKKHKLWLIAGTLTGGLANITMFFALQQGANTQVTVTVESFLVLVLVLEVILLKEKTRLFVKLIAVILTVISIVLVNVDILSVVSSLFSS